MGADDGNAKILHISTPELKEIEAEFGRINREAVERMVGATDSNQIDVCPDVQIVHKMGWLKIRKRISAPKKRYNLGGLTLLTDLYPDTPAERRLRALRVF